MGETGLNQRRHVSSSPGGFRLVHQVTAPVRR